MCSECKRSLFLGVIRPLEEILRHVTSHFIVSLEQSVTICAYLLLFFRCLFSICSSRGQVSSNMWTDLSFLSIITMSGFCTVMQISGGMNPPTKSCVARYVTVDCKLLCVHTVHHIVHTIIVAPGPPTCVHAYLADVQNMVTCLPPTAQRAQVRGGLLPSL